MRKLQRVCAVTTLVFALSISVTAGNIHTNAVPPPPPPTEAQATEPGDIHTGIQTVEEPDTLIAEITLNILQLLSVF